MLKYAAKGEGRVVEVIQRVVFGDPNEVMKLLGADTGGKINTSRIERLISLFAILWLDLYAEA